jgi:hypothetical protein
MLLLGGTDLLETQLRVILTICRRHHIALIPMVQGQDLKKNST